MINFDDPYLTSLSDCPFCGCEAIVGCTTDNFWEVQCQHNLMCPILDVEISSIEIHTLEDKWNMRVVQ